MSNKSKLRKVVNGSLVQNNVKSDIIPEIHNLLTFNFHYKKWLKSIKIGDFTNYLHDEQEFAKYSFEILNKIFPVVQEHWDEIKKNPFRNSLKHTHPVTKDKLGLVNTIVGELYEIDLMELMEDDSLSYWQLGVGQSVRVVSIYSTNANTMYPVFADYHHLLYPDVKYNQCDYGSNDFCPYSEFR